MNPFLKRIHQIKNPDLDLPKGTRNPFLDLKSVFGFTERNTPLFNHKLRSLEIDMTYVENYRCFVSIVVLLQEWLYLSTNLSSSQDDLSEISLKVSSFSSHAFRDARKKT